MSTPHRLVRIILSDDAPRRTQILTEDRAQAVADLQAENSFSLPGFPGPHVLHLSIQEGRLVFDVRNENDDPQRILALALGPFRRIIKDYDLLMESHMTAVEEGREARIQAIDMGRRGLHNEGAELLIKRLAGRITIDLDTARRLFTLVCTLHQRF